MGSMGSMGGSDSTHMTDLDAPGLAFSSTPRVSTAMHLSATLMGVACSAVRPGHRQHGRTGQAVRPGTMTDSLPLEAHGCFQHGWVESVGCLHGRCFASCAAVSVPSQCGGTYLTAAPAAASPGRLAPPAACCSTSCIAWCSGCAQLQTPCCPAAAGGSSRDTARVSRSQPIAALRPRCRKSFAHYENIPPSAAGTRPVRAVL